MRKKSRKIASKKLVTKKQKVRRPARRRPVRSVRPAEPSEHVLEHVTARIRTLSPELVPIGLARVARRWAALGLLARSRTLATEAAKLVDGEAASSPHQIRVMAEASAVFLRTGGPAGSGMALRAVETAGAVPNAQGRARSLHAILESLETVGDSTELPALGKAVLAVISKEDPRRGACALSLSAGELNRIGVSMEGSQLAAKIIESEDVLEDPFYFGAALSALAAFKTGPAPPAITKAAARAVRHHLRAIRTHVAEEGDQQWLVAKCLAPLERLDLAKEILAEAPRHFGTIVNWSSVVGSLSSTQRASVSIDRDAFLRVIDSSWQLENEDARRRALARLVHVAPVLGNGRALADTVRTIAKRTLSFDGGALFRGELFRACVDAALAIDDGDARLELIDEIAKDAHDSRSRFPDEKVSFLFDTFAIAVDRAAAIGGRKAEKTVRRVLGFVERANAVPEGAFPWEAFYGQRALIACGRGLLQLEHVGEGLELIERALKADVGSGTLDEHDLLQAAALSLPLLPQSRRMRLFDRILGPRPPYAPDRLRGELGAGLAMRLIDLV